MQPIASDRDPYNGLTRAEPTLPSSAYWDADTYQRDLDAIWYKDWLLVCREADLAQPLAPAADAACELVNRDHVQCETDASDDVCNHAEG